eukprot:Tbor_TRINITY_DN4421_c0_g1::TRINITY_DN4421_c0_g1_i1::g.7912::m.7912
MFFSTYVLTNKGPLAKIWLAAHWDKKLTRNDVKVIDLNQTVVQIVDPAVPIALRTSGELLIGVVRIYALKVKHLWKDATEATNLLRAANVQVVRTKDNAIAVTMDLVAGRTENMCEADFDDIADILKTGAATGKNISNSRADPNDVLGTAWFTAEPSQFLEEHVSSQTDDIARIRDEMQAFSISKSKSSSSEEKGRLSINGVGENLLDPMAALGDMMDLNGPGAALDALMGDAANDILEDPFAILGEEMPQQAEAPALDNAVPAAVHNKKKRGILLDTEETILSPDVLKSMVRDRSALVRNSRRFGPFNITEARQLSFLRSLEHQRTICTSAYSDIVNPALQQVFESTILEATIKAAECHENARMSTMNVNDDIPIVGEDNIDPFSTAGGGFDIFGNQMPMDDFLAPDEEEGRGSIGKKRGRESGKENKFSDSANSTLGHFRSHFKGKNSNVSFSNATKESNRIDVARMFVDVLALASHGVVDVFQNTPYGEIMVSKTALSSQPIPVA